MVRRAEYREEVKTRMKPNTAAAMRKFAALYGFESDSAATNRIVELFLFGAVGTLPEPEADVSATTGHIGPGAQS